MAPNCLCEQQLIDALIDGNNSRAQLYAGLVVMGCVAAQALSIHKNLTGTQAFLKRLFPTWSDAGIFRVDFVLVTLIGSLAVVSIISPHSVTQALAGGLGWVGCIQLAAAQK